MVGYMSKKLLISGNFFDVKDIYLGLSQPHPHLRISIFRSVTREHLVVKIKNIQANCQNKKRTKSQTAFDASQEKLNSFLPYPMFGTGLPVGTLSPRKHSPPGWKRLLCVHAGRKASIKSSTASAST